MNPRVAGILERIRTKAHHRYRQDIAWAVDACADKAAPAIERMSHRLKTVLAHETPVLFPDEQIVLMRTVKTLPPLFSEKEWGGIRERHFIHEQGHVFNICPDYASVIASGLAVVRDAAARALDANPDANTDTCADACAAGGSRAACFYRSVVECIDAVLDLCERYASAADSLGLEEVAGRLRRVTSGGAQSFADALQLFRILHYTLWCEGEYHNTVGRFDQYMLPYLQNDLDSGVLTEESAYELLLEFFITFNKDSDLYPGVQQGDNGQSMMLGGLTPDGADGFNILSEMCLRASKDLKLIDPKINLRVHKGTPLSVYERGTELTRVGLGFPQYSNDDVVIPGLLEKGYSLEDAREYVVAACWEFIIPRYGMDVVNIGALSFPSVVDWCLHNDLAGAGDFERFQSAVRSRVRVQCDEIINGFVNLYMIPAPFMSIMMDDCVEAGRDISEGARYNNYGIHGTGLSTAVDSLAAIKKHVFAEKTVSAEALIDAVDSNFEGYGELLTLLRFQSPKIGNDDDAADALAGFLLGAFAEALEGRRNERGGCYRAGTGSAMYYLWHAAETGASADGRKAGEPFSCNYSPSLSTRLDGPISVIKSFVKPDLKKTINGGPLTMEFHESIFRDQESIKKVACIVKYFIDSGGHQLQLNAIDREALLDAQKAPERYQSLIVRVWGWSAYFVELDRDYQNHIIARQEHG